MGTGNVVAPSGNLYTQGQMPLVPTNAMVADPQEMGNIPIQPGKNVYIRDVATIQDTTDINYGCALVNGRRSIYIPVVKKDTASTLTVVQQIHDSMPLFQSVVPEDVNVRYEFDESPTVRAAIKSVATEGLIGALLTGLMILIFLRDVRTVIVVVVGIPLALTAALVGLWLTGNTINIMSLGGLALSIGILVDMAIVTVENTHVQMRHTESVARAVRRSDAATVTSRLLAMLCILSVFIPTFLMREPVRSLFMPLTIAVGFAMIAAFLMSSTVVPVLSVWLIRYRAEEPAAKKGFIEKILPAFQRIVYETIRFRWIVVPAYLVACGLLLWLVGRQVGTELFPQVDSGQFVIRFRSPPGSEYELTRKCALKILEVIDAGDAGKGGDLDGLRGVGRNQHRDQQHSAVHARHRRRSAPSAAAGESGIRIAELRERLRKALPEQVVPWLKGVLKQEGCSPEEARSPREEVFLRLRAGRHRQHGDEFRFADARRSGGCRSRTGHSSRARAQSPGGDEEDSQPPRRAALPATRLPDGASGHRSREGRPQRRDRQGRYRRAVGGNFFQPLRGQELLARPEVRRRLSGPGPGPHAADEPAAAGRNPSAGKVNPDTNLMVRDVAKVQTGHRAGRDRSQRHAALSEHYGQYRGRRPRPGDDPHRAGHRKPPASRRAECASASAARLRR